MRQDAINFIEEKQLRKDLPAFRAGDTVRVHTKIKEGDKERIQIFEGVVIRRRQGQSRATFTVRKMSYGVGVERIFPTHSPRIDRVEVVGQGKVNRARLFYLRNLQGRAARIDREDYQPAVAAAKAAKAAPATPAPETPAAPEAPAAS